MASENVKIKMRNGDDKSGDILQPAPGEGVQDRAANEDLRRFHNHGECPYEGLSLLRNYAKWVNMVRCEFERLPHWS